MGYSTLTELHALLEKELTVDRRRTREVRAALRALSAEPSGPSKKIDTLEAKLQGVQIETTDGQRVMALDYRLSGGDPDLVYVLGKRNTPMTRDEVSDVLDRTNNGKGHFYRNNTSKAFRFTERSTGEPIKMGRAIELDKEYSDLVFKVGKDNAGPRPVIRDFSPNSHYVITGVRDPNKYKSIVVDTNATGLAYQFTLSKSSPSSAATNRDRVDLHF